MKRDGKSLVEMLVVISMLGGLIATSGTVIHRLMRAERAVSADLVWQRSVTELAEQFRTDVHAATQAALLDDGNGLSLTLSDGVVTYAVSKQGVGRLWQPGAGEVRSLEYRLDEPGVKFAAETVSERNWATLLIPRTNTALVRTAIPDVTSPQIAIRAVVGRLSVPARKDGVS